MTVPVNDVVLRRHVVRRVSGDEVVVQTQAEAEWFVRSRDTYLRETKFSEGTDLQDLDRLLVLELMIFRWQQHLFAGRDYYGDEINEKQLTMDMKLYSDQLTKVKESMGLSKKARDELASEGNFAQWLADLKARGKLFGVHRETQLSKMLALGKELFTIVGTFDRCDEEERRKIGFESESNILDWIRTVMRPEYERLDAHFREHEQRYWRRD